MLPKFDLNAERQRWKSLGQCLKEGELILSPFENPIEEERRGDPDQADDDANFLGADNICVMSEPSLDGHKKSVRSLPMESAFRYFLDGSIRTKYVGEYIEGSLSFPLIVSEIAVAVMCRSEKTLRPAILQKDLYFVFPHKDSGLITDTTYDRLMQMQNRFAQESASTRIEFMKKTEIVRDPRSSLLGKVRALMHEMEGNVAGDLVRNKEEWLVMDGTIDKGMFLHLPNTIGLAKSFSRKPVFSMDGHVLTLSAYMKDIGEGERSAVFRKIGSSGKAQPDLVFWYLRMRTFPPMEPLGGIVKIDLNIPGDAQLTTDQVELVDRISSDVFSMRFPSVYPWPRWPSYIYPIRLAEMSMASAFLSPAYLSQIGEELKTTIQLIA